MADDVAQGAAEEDRKARRGGLRRPPGAKGEARARLPVVLQRHGGGQGGDGEEPRAKADGRRPRRRTARALSSGPAKITAEKAAMPTRMPRAAMRKGSRPVASQRAASRKPTSAPMA